MRNDCKKEVEERRKNKQQGKYFDSEKEIYKARIRFCKQTEMVQFESLPNEIVLDCFEYFDSVHLFRAFHGLNCRFNTLLYNLYQMHQFDFQRISKQDFDIVCQQYLPFIVDRVASICLSNSDRTSDLPLHFFSQNFTLTQFINLRSLTLSYIQDDDAVNILREIYQLKHLIYLSIIYCVIPCQEENTLYFWNQIWALPKLKHLNFKTIDRDIDVSKLITISPSLENLSITTVNVFSFYAMVCIFQHTPYLRTLSTDIAYGNFNEINSIAFPSITTLKLVFHDKPQVLNNFFQNMPNLCCLIIDIPCWYLTGHEWKKILINNLPKIKIFRFKMCISLFGVDDKEKRVDEILDTFRTSFWLDEHKWFVRCDWEPVNGQISSIFYTLPYAFDTFTGIINGRSKWTSPDDKREYWLFNDVRSFICKASTNECLNVHPICFPKIQELVISYPVHEHIWCSISTFNYLTRLHIFVFGNRIESNLQILFNRAPHLYELIVADACKRDYMELSRLGSTSIRQLYFHQSDRACAPAHSLDDDDCALLAESSLGHQCEILSGIHVESPTNVIYLVNTMNNLRALTIYCKLEKFEKLSPTRAEFNDWLLNHLPAKCSISRCKIFQDYASIVLWIGSCEHVQTRARARNRSDSGPERIKFVPESIGFVPDPGLNKLFSRVWAQIRL
jgi:hypothetical protein